MLSYFKISAYNDQALFFWGSESDAERYTDWLNRDREQNVYTCTAIPQDQWSELEHNSDVLSGEESHWDDFMDDEA